MNQEGKTQYKNTGPSHQVGRGSLFFALNRGRWTEFGVSVVPFYLCLLTFFLFFAFFLFLFFFVEEERFLFFFLFFFFEEEREREMCFFPVERRERVRELMGFCCVL